VSDVENLNPSANSSDQSSAVDAKVLDFNSFKKKKSGDGELARGRNPLYKSHLEGKVTGSPHFKRPEAEDFGDRLTRIRTSLEKINGLISELKKMSATKSDAKSEAKQ